MGRSPRTAADAPVGLLAPYKMLISLFRLRDEGVPRGPGGPPHHFGRIRSLGKTKLHCALLRPARSYFQRLIPLLPIAIAVSAIKMRMPVRTSAAGSSASDITACEIKSKGSEWMYDVC